MKKEMIGRLQLFKKEITKFLSECLSQECMEACELLYMSLLL